MEKGRGLYERVFIQSLQNRLFCSESLALLKLGDRLGFVYGDEIKETVTGCIIIFQQGHHFLYLFCVQFFVLHYSKLLVKLKVTRVAGIVCSSKTWHILHELKEDSFLQKLTELGKIYLLLNTSLGVQFIKSNYQMMLS